MADHGNLYSPSEQESILRALRAFLHQLEQPERGGGDGIDAVAECQPLERRVEHLVANLVDMGVARDDKVDKQLAELAGGLDIAWRDLTELTKRMNGYDQQLAALDDAIRPPPKPACEHCRSSGGTYIVGLGNSMTAPTCDNPECSAVFLSGTWYHPQPPTAKPPACEHPKKALLRCINKESGVEFDLCRACGSRRYVGADEVWYIPQPPSEKAEGGETEKGANDEE